MTKSAWKLETVNNVKCEVRRWACLEWSKVGLWKYSNLSTCATNSCYVGFNEARANSSTERRCRVLIGYWIRDLFASFVQSHVRISGFHWFSLLTYYFIHEEACPIVWCVFTTFKPRAVCIKQCTHKELSNSLVHTSSKFASNEKTKQKQKLGQIKQSSSDSPEC